MALVGSWGPSTLRAEGPIDASAVAAVAKEEIKAGRLHVDAQTCVAFGPDDPSDRLLRDLRRSGLAFRKASACRHHPPSGRLLNLIRIAPAGSERLTVDVEVDNLNIDPSVHFAIRESRGMYTLTKTTSGWSVANYESRPTGDR